jgi:hypothetical protein
MTGLWVGFIGGSISTNRWLAIIGYLMTAVCIVIMLIQGPPKEEP